MNKGNKMAKLIKLYTVWMKYDFSRDGYENGITYVFDSKKKMNQYIKCEIEKNTQAGKQVSFIVRCYDIVEKIKKTSFNEKRYLIEGTIAFTVHNMENGAIFHSNKFDLYNNQTFDSFGFQIDRIDNSKELKARKNI